MKSTRKAISFLMLLILLAGCNLPTANKTPPPNPGAVATEVEKMLTSAPGETVIPSPVITQSIPTETIQPTTAPTLTPEPSLTPTKTQAVQQTTVSSPTSATNDPRNTLGAPTRSDKMDNTQFWFPFEDEHVKIEITKGMMKMTALKADGWHGWTVSSPSVKNFYIEETAQPGSCEGKDSYGLMVRSPDGNKGYFYGFSCDGRFIFQKWDGEKFDTLVNWTENTAIIKGPDKTNRLGLIAKDNQFTLYANGVKIGETRDSAYTEGIFGLYVAAYQTNNFTVDVDQVDYWNQP